MSDKDKVIEELPARNEEIGTLQKELGESKQRNKEMEAENEARLAQKDGEIARLEKQVAQQDKEKREGEIFVRLGWDLLQNASLTIRMSISLQKYPSSSLRPRQT